MPERRDYTQPRDRPLTNWTAIAFLMGLTVQGAAIVWWGSGLDERVSALEARTAPLADGTLARLDERTAAIKEAVERLERREEARRGTH